jgi:preprotein translocase subunit YajC
VEALLPFAVLLLAFWLLIIRPARTRSRQQNELQSRLSPGLEVMTTSGLFATVAEVQDDAVVLETSPGTRSRWAKAAVARILTPPRDADDDETTTAADTTSDSTPPGTAADPTSGRPE